MDLRGQIFPRRHEGAELPVQEGVWWQSLHSGMPQLAPWPETAGQRNLLGLCWLTNPETTLQCIHVGSSMAPAAPCCGLLPAEYELVARWKHPCRESPNPGTRRQLCVGGSCPFVLGRLAVTLAV